MMKKVLLIALMLSLSICMIFANGAKEAAVSKTEDVQLRMMWWGWRLTP